MGVRDGSYGLAAIGILGVGKVVKPVRTFIDDMSPEEAKKYLKYWEKFAPENSTPYDLRRRYTPSGDIKQVTTYNSFGRHHRQYDLMDSRHGEHQHNFDYLPNNMKPRRTDDHRPIDE